MIEIKAPRLDCEQTDKGSVRGLNSNGRQVSHQAHGMPNKLAIKFNDRYQRLPARSHVEAVNGFDNTAAKKLDVRALYVCGAIAVAHIFAAAPNALVFYLGHGLRVFQRAAGFEVGGDLHAELGGAALDHALGVDAMHDVAVELAVAAAGGAEQGALAVAGDAGGADVFIQ
jgi:hypothetical protein